MRISTYCREALVQIGPVATTVQIANWVSSHYQTLSKEQVSAALSRASRDPESNIVHIGGPRSGTFALATAPTANVKNGSGTKEYREFKVKAFLPEEPNTAQYLDTYVVLALSAWLVKNWATDEPEAIGPEEEAMLDLLDEQTKSWLSEQIPDGVAEARIFVLHLMTTAASILYESAMEFALAFDPREGNRD